jgi:hypothetical protein
MREEKAKLSPQADATDESSQPTPQQGLVGAMPSDPHGGDAMPTTLTSYDGSIVTMPQQFVRLESVGRMRNAFFDELLW